LASEWCNLEPCRVAREFPGDEEKGKKPFSFTTNVTKVETKMPHLWVEGRGRGLE